MYGRSRVNVKAQPHLTLTFARELSYIAYILFRARKNPPLEKNAASLLKINDKIL